MQATLDRPVAPPGGAPQEDGTERDRPRWPVELGLLTLLLATLAAAAYRVWDRAWTTPFVHSGDHLAFVALAGSAGWTGTPGTSEQLGAPYGVDWVDTPSGADRAHLIVLRLLRAVVGGDAVVAANLYLLLAVVLVGLAAYVVIRSLRISAAASSVAAASFAIAPAMFVRAGVGHLFLVAYVAVPVGVWLALWATRSPGVGRWVDARSPRRWIVPTLLVLLVGSASAYYATFALVGVVALGAVVALRRGSWAVLARPAAVAGGVLGVVALNIAGEVLARGETEASTRVALDADAYGLRIAQMLLPIRDHRVDALASWADRAYRIDAPGDTGAALGLLAVVGLVAVVLWCVRHVGRDVAGGTQLAGVSHDLLAGSDPIRRGALARLGVVAVVTVLVATASGLAMVLATFGVTQIRAWSRASSVVGFVGVIGVALLLDATFRRWRPSAIWRAAAVVCLVLFAFVDQVSPSALPPPEHNETRWQADQELAGQLERALPAGSTVFQLPLGTFPAELPVGELGANDLFGPALAGSGELRWNVGAMKGSEGDWQLQVAANDAATMVDQLAAAEVAALVLDRRGLDGDTALEDDLRRELGAPDGETGDGTRLWWDLRAVRDTMVQQLGEDRVEALGDAVARPVGVVVEGSPGVRTTVDARARHLEARSRLRVTDHGSTGGPVALSFELSGEPGATVRIEAPGATRTVVLDDEPTPVRLSLDVAPGSTRVVELTTDAAPIAEVSAWGDLRLRLDALRAVDPGAAPPGE